MSVTENKVISLGQYKGLHARKPVITVTDEEVEQRFEKEKGSMALRIDITDRGVQQGDVAYIDYTGYMGGRPFKGGSAKDFPLEIGSGKFIPGFEDQIEAAEVGDKVTVRVTFPADYPAKQYAGKPAEFKCKINRIEEVHYPKLDEEISSKIRLMISDEKHAEAEAALEDQLLAKIAEGSQFVLSDDSVDEAIEVLYDEWAEDIKKQGYDPVKYLKVFGMDEETEKDIIIRPQAEARIKGQLVLQAIAEKENFAVTDEDVDAQVGLIAMHLGMQKEVLKQRFDEKAFEQVREDVLVTKALEIIKTTLVYE